MVCSRAADAEESEECAPARPADHKCNILRVADRDPVAQHVKYCIYDPPVVRARTLPTLRHQRLENRPFLIAEIESHDPPPPAVNHDPCCFSVNYIS